MIHSQCVDADVRILLSENGNRGQRDNVAGFPNLKRLYFGLAGRGGLDDSTTCKC
jgi:hypothetical protein